MRPTARRLPLVATLAAACALSACGTAQHHAVAPVEATAPGGALDPCRLMTFRDAHTLIGHPGPGARSRSTSLSLGDSCSYSGSSTEPDAQVTVVTAAMLRRVSVWGFKARDDYIAQRHNASVEAGRLYRAPGVPRPNFSAVTATRPAASATVGWMHGAAVITVAVSNDRVDRTDALWDAIDLARRVAVHIR